VAAVVMLAAVPASAAVAAPPPALRPVHAELPAPTGPYPVGSTELHLVDDTRLSPWVPATVRELMVTIRYPARHDGGPRASFMAPGVARIAVQEIAGELGVDPARLDFGFATNAHPGAAAAGGRRPVVLYSPGGGTSRSLGTAQMEQLASEGYVVVAFDHTYEAIAVEFPDGRVARQALPPSSPEVLRQMMATRVQDTGFVLNQLEVLATGGNPDAGRRELPRGLRGSLDLSRVGMFGHSAGGFTAGETMVSDRRIDAGADLDGSMMYSRSAGEFGRVADEGLDRPFLLMSAGDHTAASDPSWQRFLTNHRGWVRQLHLPAGEHFSYTDHQALLPQLVSRLDLDPAVPEPYIGRVDPARSVAAQRAYLTAYFDLHLRHRPQRLLDHPSPEHPDVQFLSAPAAVGAAEQPLR
jgi:predicted dienelactone hydrolase